MKLYILFSLIISCLINSLHIKADEIYKPFAEDILACNLGLLIHVRCDSLFIVSAGINLLSGEPGVGKQDTIAACRIEKYGDNIVRLYTEDLLLRPIKGMICEKDTCTTDSAEIKIELPMLRAVDVEVEMIYLSNHNMFHKKHIVTPQSTSHTFNVPKNTEQFNIFIRGIGIEPTTMAGTYYGIIQNPNLTNIIITKMYDIPEFKVKGHNVRITLPYVDRNLFERWYFDGDFVYMNEHEIRWKNLLWVKDPEN